MSKPRLTIYDTKFFRIATPEGKVIPVVLRSESHERGDISKLESINMYAQNSGQNVPLTQVADIVVAFEPSKILRRDQSKALTVSSELDERAGVTVFDIVAELEPWLVEQRAGWPVSYAYEIGGESEVSTTANQSIVEKLPFAGLLILLLLVFQFKSLRKSAIILFTTPLALIGVVIMFGLVFTTVLALGFVPALYAVLFRVKTAELTVA